MYKGPKRTMLLPDDYLDSEPAINDAPESDVPSENSDGDNGVNTSNDAPDNKPREDSDSGAKWSAARKSFTKAVGGSRSAVERAVRSYTKALGGHKNAVKQAKAARAATSKIFGILSGGYSEIRDKLEKAGIEFEGKSTDEIFIDICNYLSPGHDTTENALVSIAIDEAVSDILTEEGFNPTSLEVFNEELLSTMVGNFVKHFVYDKLIHEVSYGMLCNNKTDREIKRMENSLKDFISGIVDIVVEDYVHPGVSQGEIDSVVKSIYEESYKVMENFQR